MDWQHNPTHWRSYDFKDYRFDIWVVFSQSLFLSLSADWIHGWNYVSIFISFYFSIRTTSTTSTSTTTLVVVDWSCIFTTHTHTTDKDFSTFLCLYTKYLWYHHVFFIWYYMSHFFIYTFNVTLLNVTVIFSLPHKGFEASTACEAHILELGCSFTKND